MRNANAIAAVPENNRRVKMPVNRLGRGYLFDPASSRMISLPDGWLIHHFNHRIWMGGSMNGEIYLHLERFSTATDSLPDIWAEEDLDLFICKTTPEEQTNDKTTKANVTGSFFDRSIQGILAKVQISEQDAYLVLVATEEGSQADLGAAIDAITQTMIAS